VSRVLVLGLDSADAELIERWADEGHLPTFAALRRSGAWERLGTTAEVLHVSAWPTIYTGATPGRHGLYHAYQARAGTQALHRTRVEWGALPAFWQLLDRVGKRCLVMDAFMDRPLNDFGGTQIVEYGTWTWFSDPGGRPRRVHRELMRRFGPYPAPEHSKVLTVPEPVWFRDQLVAGARRKGEVVGWLLGEMPWDMAFIGFGEPHGAGHYLWHVSDPEYPSHPAAGVPGAEHALRDVYAAVDEALGTILARVDRSTTILVTSGDGMGPNYSAPHLLPEVLHRLGLFHGAGVGAGAAGDAPAAPGKKGGLAAAIRQMIPLQARQAVTKCLPRSLHYRLSMKWVNSAIDWERSKAVCIPNSNEGYVRVNLEGRESRGIVPQGAAYEDLLAEMEVRLGELVEPTRGRTAAERLVRMDRMFAGSERRHLPDLVFTWDPGARVLGDLESAACGRVHGPAGYELAPYYTGNHRPTAFVAGKGPGIGPGVIPANGHIVDLPPTIFALLGVEPAAQFEGRAWTDFTRR
jgi:predicted AlkP superfamily phosphohydrolase/phosphomutase